MSSNKIIISCFILLNASVHIQTLVELPIVEDNNIAIVETAIRNTVNNLFIAFKLQDIKHSPRIKQFSIIHNFFVSITLTDCVNLREIARLTQVYNIDNVTQHFITQINEVLNEDDKSNEAADINNVYVTRYIDIFIRKLKYLKNLYIPDGNTIINADILKYLTNDINPLANITQGNNIYNFNNNNKNVLLDNEFWRSSGRRIFNGIRTNIKMFPFMASIQYFKKFQCAGSIIKNDLIITSSSCLQLAWNNRFFRENPAFLSVQVGSDYYERSGDNIAVLDIYFHPNYNPKTLSHNLAVVRLTRKINLRNKRVKKIDFDRNPWPMPVNSGKITVIGWGAKDSRNVISNVFENELSYAELNLYPHRDCQEHYSEEFVTTRTFCAGFYSRGSGACNRDAGGPGIIENILMGVISFGSPICGAPDTPTVFTKLGYYTDWIETIMEQVVYYSGKRTTKAPPPLKYSLPQSTVIRNFTPIILPTKISPIPINDLDEILNLREADDIDFQEFIKTMFSSKEIKEYIESNDETSTENSDELISNIEEKQTDVPKKTILKTASDHPTTANLLDELIYDDIRSAMEVSKKENIKTTTESEIQVTVMNEDDHRKIFESDVLSLIDSLDINKLFNVLPENILENPNYNSTVNESIAIIMEELAKHEENVLKEAENIENENITKEEKGPVMALSGSPNEIKKTKQQTILNFLFLPHEAINKPKPKQIIQNKTVDVKAVIVETTAATTTTRTSTGTLKDLTFRHIIANNKTSDSVMAQQIYPVKL